MQWKPMTNVYRTLQKVVEAKYSRRGKVERTSQKVTECLLITSGDFWMTKQENKETITKQKEKNREGLLLLGC